MFNGLTVDLYCKGPTGTWRDHIDPEMTTREAVAVAREEAKRQWGLLKEDFVYYHTRRERLAIKYIELSWAIYNYCTTKWFRA